MSKKIRIILGIILIIIGISSLASHISTPTSSEEEQVYMTLEKFNKIESGMTYQQVVDIIGKEGTLSTESSYGSETMQIYYWYASNEIANATISFSNGKVIAKNQIGLE